MTSCKRNTVRTPAWRESVWGSLKRVTHSLAFPTWDSLFLNWNRKDWMRETWDFQNIPKESFNSDSLFDFPWGTSGRSTLLTTCQSYKALFIRQERWAVWGFAFLKVVSRVFIAYVIHGCGRVYLHMDNCMQEAWNCLVIILKLLLIEVGVFSWT